MNFRHSDNRLKQPTPCREEFKKQQRLQVVVNQHSIDEVHVFFSPSIMNYVGVESTNRLMQGVDNCFHVSSSACLLLPTSLNSSSIHVDVQPQQSHSILVHTEVPGSPYH